MPLRRTISGLIEKIKSLRSHPSDYQELWWVVYLFLGGAVDAVALRNFGDWLSPVLQYLRDTQLYIFQVPEALIFSVVFGAIVFIVPIALSFLFSRFYPESRIVPPLYMQMIAFAFLMFFVYNRIPTDFFTNYLLGFYAFIAGLVQDSVVVSALGRAVSRNDIIRHSFKIYADIKEVRQILTSKIFLERRKFEVIQGMNDCSIKLKSGKKLGKQLFWNYKKELNKTRQF